MVVRANLHNRQKTTKKFKVSPFLLFLLQILVLGSVLLCFSVTFSANALSVEMPLVIDVSLMAKQEEEEPIRIVIPVLSVDLLVKKAKIAGDTWEIFEKEAGFGDGSSFLNDKSGNTIVFAHARDGLFKDLNKLKKGDPVYIFSKKNWYGYKVLETVEVNPEDVSKMYKDLGKGLVLITCSGESDDKRTLVYGEAYGAE